MMLVITLIDAIEYQFEMETHLIFNVGFSYFIQNNPLICISLFHLIYLNTLGYIGGRY